MNQSLEVAALKTSCSPLCPRGTVSGRLLDFFTAPGRGARGEGVLTPRLDRLRFLRTWIACCCLLGVRSALSQDTRAQIKTAVDATTVTIGDVVTVKFSVKHPAILKIALPPVGTSLGEWTVRSSKQRPSSKLPDGNIEDGFDLQLAAYKTGAFEVPALNVDAVKANGETEVLASEPIKIVVQSVLTGKQDTLKDLKPQAELETDYKGFLFFLAALASAAYLVYRLIQYLKHRKRARAPKQLLSKKKCQSKKWPWMESFRIEIFSLFYALMPFSDFLSLFIKPFFNFFSGKRSQSLVKELQLFITNSS